MMTPDWIWIMLPIVFILGTAAAILLDPVIKREEENSWRKRNGLPPRK